MQTQDEIKKPTLDDLGIKCAVRLIGPCIREGNWPCLEWCFVFSNKHHSEAFEYFTGTGCGPQISEQDLRRGFPLVANVAKHNRHNITDKLLLAQIASYAVRKAKWTPDPIEVLWSIARDSDALEMTFEDWAGEFGYDTDSRKAEKTYRACQDGALRLKKILSEDKFRQVRALVL